MAVFYKTLRMASEGDLERIVALEQEGYPADEAASPSRLKYRFENARDFMYTLWIKENAESPLEMVGFVTSTLVDKILTEESMAEDGHVPTGDSCAIHSVVVAPKFQCQGLGHYMMTEYCRAISKYLSNSADEGPSYPNLKRMLLIAKEVKAHWYQRLGFVSTGPSKVVHGKDMWLDMFMDLPFLTSD